MRLNTYESDPTLYILSRCTEGFIYEFNATKGSLTEHTSRPPLTRCSIGKHQHRIYAIAGLREDKVCDVGLIYDLNEKTWTEFDSPTGRFFGTACTAGDKMYMIGGQDSDQNLTKICSVYDFTTNQWTQLPDMREERGQAAVCYYNNALYVMGGFTNCTDQIERYDPREGIWSRAGSMNSGGAMTSAVVGDTFHLMNSYTGKYCEFYPQQNVCTQERTWGFLGKQWLASLDDKLYLLHYNGIDVFDRELHQWTNVLNRNIEKCPFLLASCS